MVKNELHPPLSGPGSDPVLYGVAAGLAQLFPLVIGHSGSDGEPVDSDESEQD